jgi:hypothetical protein
LQKLSIDLVRVSFSSPHNENIDENVIIRRIHAHIPSLQIPGAAPVNALVPVNRQVTAMGAPSAVNEVRISGSFMIYGSDLVEIALFHLIMNDPLFSAYLYLDEGGKSFAEKTRLNIHYRGASTDLGESRGQYRTDANGKKKLKRRSKHKRKRKKF